MLKETVRKRVRNNPPCYKCEERVQGCHGRCERYQEWRAVLEGQNEAEHYQKQKQLILIKQPRHVVREIEKKRWTKK